MRIITRSQTLYEPEDAPAYVCEESYVELKCADGSIDFITISSAIAPYQGEKGMIRGLIPPSFTRKERHALDTEASGS